MRELPGGLLRRPIAHRGLHDPRASTPENSLPAFKAAAEQGLPCELDVQQTRDGDVVVVHDYDLGRLTGKHARLADLDRTDVRRLRLLDTEHGIPALAEVLDVVAGRVPLLIELKHQTTGRARALEGAVARVVAGHPGELAFCSFDPLAVRRMRATMPEAAVGQVAGNLAGAHPVSRFLGARMVGNALTRPDFISYELAGLPCRAVTRASGRGLPVLVWGVRTEAQRQDAVRLADNYIFDGEPPVAGDDGWC